MQQVVRGGSPRRGDLAAFKILERINPLFGMCPDLADCPFKIVDQKHFSLPASREIGQHASGGEDVEAAPDQSLKQLDTGCELTRLDPQVLALPGTEVSCKPEMRVDAEHMQIADPHGIGSLGRDRPRAARERQRATTSRGQEIAAIERARFHTNTPCLVSFWATSGRCSC